ncbi:MAG: 4Fe-4S dicluster domain-containing protein [Firmicutes bacterium]|nr:4Fe-4S dicluster domain-containing protein [Bacillota bacterium]
MRGSAGLDRTGGPGVQGTGVGVLDKGELAGFLGGLIARYRVFAPVQEAETTRFAPVSSAGEVTMPATVTSRPLKEIFLPPSETLLEFEVGTAGGMVSSVKVEPVGPGVGVGTGIDVGVGTSDDDSDRPRVIFGTRPCDARSLLLLDKVFDSADYKDGHYVARRRGTAIISVACNEPAETCFCTSTGGGPFDEAGSDVILEDLGEVYLVKAVTDRGAELIAGLEGAVPGFWRLSRPAEDGIEGGGRLEAEDDERLEQLLAAGRDARKRAEARIPALVPARGIHEKLKVIFEHECWGELYRKCLGCAACAYLCPTCHCFDIADEAIDSKGRRVRCWDACMFPMFTLHASGHNPRPGRKERFRQRVMHKFSYFVENNGDIACVGCGRCIENCPVNMDIRSVLASLDAISISPDSSASPAVSAGAV